MSEKPKGKRGPAKGQGGRPKGEDRRKITAHITDETWEAIDAVMMEQGCSTGQAIDLIVKSKPIITNQESSCVSA